MIRTHIYPYPDVKNVIVCGDIHGAFSPVVYKLCLQYAMTDTLLIVAGDCGFGFERPGYYDRVYQEVSRKLAKSDNYIAFVRGNHDDPAYFSQERIHNKRFRTIPDYGVIQACGHDILCVGGAVSVDRRDRISENSRRQRKETAVYWPDEVPVYDEAALDAVSGEMNIDTIVTHTSPSFCEPLTKDGLQSWALHDDMLLADCDNEWSVMDRLHGYLKNADHPVTHWYYGHFHRSWSACIDDIMFSMLDIEEFKEIPPTKQVMAD